MEENRIQRSNDGTKISDIVAFWIFGLCNNYGYVVMLTAANDILNSNNMNKENLIDDRNCTFVSTGAILLADIIPAFIIKLLSPFLPYHTTSRIFLSCLTSIFSFILVATASSRWIVILGVTATSFSSGLGEPTFLYHSTYYDKNTISSWSSGTGAAGVVGALSYSILRQMGLNSYNTLILMILIPLVELSVYMKVLSSPVAISNDNSGDHIINDNNNENSPLIRRESNLSNTVLTFAEKCALFPMLLVYILPLSLVYFFEYYINQGLFELIVFENISLTKEQQYYWFQVTYQIGVFIARSSVNFIKIKQTWILAIIQGVIAIFFTFEAIYLFLPSIWIVMSIILVEGFHGGLVYVNTFYRINQEVMPALKTYAMNIVALSDSFGIILAGFFAIIAHNFICSL
ncbi:battenin-like [Chironomus tepperi]|uniref:battenin-like n=1 Tax=Chironomus tepperi TaxID=113505 RepID=UPI00391F6035